MFKSLQWRIVLMFVLLVLSVMIIAGTFLLTRVGEFYSHRFSYDMALIFTDEQITDELTVAAGQATPEYRLKQIIDAYSGAGRLGINQSRNYYILDGTTGEYLNGSEEVDSATLEKTSNLISAMNGRIGNAVTLRNSFMDYAFPVRGLDGHSYVIYIKDDKNEVQSIIQSIFWIILQALGWGIVISLIFGFFLSRNITKPIVSLTRRAERLAVGEPSDTGASAKKAEDEIGILSDTFAFMSRELLHTLNQIESEKTKMETILVNLTDGVIAFGLDGKIIHINPAAKRMLSICNARTVEFDLLFSDIGAKIYLGDILYLEQNKPFERVITLNGQVIRAYFAAFRAESEKAAEKVGGVVVALQDITTQQKLDDSRREFVANVSHELRTPLTTIKSYTETLMDTLPDASGDNMTGHFLSVINSETDRMARIVKDLLTLSHLDHGKNVLKQNEIDMAKLLSGVTEKLSLDAKAHKHTLLFSPTTTLPLYHGDRDRLEQVIINIVSNAIKYTPDGGRIEIFAGRVYNGLYIKVKDNGIGIPKPDLERIFERFYRVDKARTRQAGGTGLGLAIAKEIVEAHGGKIVITSKPGNGSEVIITLPIEPENSHPEATES